jgi:hypothetical protein
MAYILLEIYILLTVLNSSLEALATTLSGLLSPGATGLGTSDFPAEVESFALIIFEISYSRHSITNTSGEGSGFGRAIFIAAIVIAISMAWPSLNAITGNRRGLSGGVVDSG